MQTLEIVRPEPAADDAFLDSLLCGYRFRMCTSPEDIARAIAVRRRVYVQGNGYDIPVPDAYDDRSWHVLAEDTVTGIACGSMRMTPRSQGPLEAEEYFELPRPLRHPGTIEIARFAILPEYRKGKTFLPVVSLGMFTLVKQMLDRTRARRMVICTKPERLWTFEWMHFQRTGLRARYEKLGGTEHELLGYDLHRLELLDSHPFRRFLVGGYEFPEVQAPAVIPQLGLLGGVEVPAALCSSDAGIAEVA